MKKTVGSIMLALVMAFSVLVPMGCSTTEREFDKTKTQLYINIFDGGLGSEWSTIVGKRFEEKYKDWEGVNGKIGVEVVPVATKDTGSDTIAAGIRSGTITGDIFANMNGYQDWARLYPDLCEDLTDIANEKIYGEDGNLVPDGQTGTKSITDKMNLKNVEQHTVNGKLVSLPYEKMLWGFVYDHELFTEKGYLSYGNGPDGQPNTYDDGLPATFDDFKNLFSRMIADNICPFTYTTGNTWYMRGLTTSVQLQVDGFDEIDKVYTCTADTAAQVADRKGAKQAIEFIQFLFSKQEHISQKALTTSLGQTEAQYDFISSKLAAENGDAGVRRIAMIVEGDWWENEARSRFNEMTKMPGADESYGYGKRDFRFLPLPRFEGQAFDGSAYACHGDGGTIFVSSKSENKELAKKYIQFLISNDSMVEFSTATGSTLAFDMKLPTQKPEGMTKFAWNVCKLKDEYADSIYVAPKRSTYCIMKKADEVFMKMPADGYNTTAVYEEFNAHRSTDANAATAYFNGYKTYFANL